MGLASKIVHVDNDTKTYTFSNGSQIVFMGENFADDKELTRFAGLECNGFGADEINELQEETFDKMIERSGTWFIDPMPPKVVLATCNPAHNWVKTKVYDRYTTGTLPDTWLYIPARVTDNPHVPPEYVKSLEVSMPPIKFRRFVEGDWEAKEVSNAFALHYSYDKHASPNARLSFERSLYLSVDFNINPFGAIAYQMWSDHEGEHFHIVDEIEIENGDINKMAEEIKRRYRPLLPTLTITGDAMGKQRDIGQRDNISLYMQLQRELNLSKKQIVVPSNPTHENSRSDVNWVLLYYPDFKIWTGCKNTLRDMENVECDIYGKIKKRDRKDPNQRADHLDCVRYAVNTSLKKWIQYSQKSAPRELSL